MNDEARELAEAQQAAAQYFIDLFAGVCPFCKQPYTERQVRRSVYAEPCGHRLYQGKVGAFVRKEVSG